MSTVSIAIPAKNGGEYLKQAIESVLAQDLKGLEIVVSIDGPIDEFTAVAALFSDSRLRFVRPPRPMSMAGHYEWCLAQLNGDWVTIMGQDDGLLPNFTQVVKEVIDVTEPPLAISFRRAYFFWPGCDSLYGSKVVQLEPSSVRRPRSAKVWLLRTLVGCADHYDLPQIYTNNLIHKSVIREILGKSQNRFYWELTPDVYSGLVIAVSLDRWLRVETPVFWTGTSPRSTGFALSQSSVAQGLNDFEVARRSHLESGHSDGLGFSPKVGGELWLAANSSALYCLSAIDSIPFSNPWQGRKILLYAAFATAVAQTALSKLPVFPSQANRSLTRSLLRKQAQILDLNPVVLGLFGLMSLPLLLVRRFGRILQITCRRRRSWIVRKGDASPNCVRDANSLFKSEFDV
jgi:hypothetical protein